MDRFEAMSLLLEVVDRGSLSAAGRALRIPIATVSRKLTDLEARLGTQLLVRTTRKLDLTDAGAAYVSAARRILEQVDDAEREAAGEFKAPKGELTMTAPVMFGRLYVLPVVADFLAQFPAINVRLLLSDRTVHLVDDHIDMAVRIGALPSSAMVATRVGEMRTVVCASPGLLAAHGVPQAPADLQRLPCVSVDTPSLAPAWWFRAGERGSPVAVPVVPRLSVTCTDAAVSAALAGVGATRLFHYQVADAVAEGALQILLGDHEPVPAPVHLLHAGPGHMPLKMRRFIDFAVPRLRAALSASPGAAGPIK